MKRLTIVFLISNFLQAYTPKELIAVSFTSLYPDSSFKQAKKLATQLWSEVNESMHNQQAYNHLQETITDFAYTVLELHILVDCVLKQTRDVMRGISTRYQEQDILRIMQELAYLHELIASVHRVFDEVMQEHQSDQAACVTVTFDYMQKKMERMLAASAP